MYFSLLFFLSIIIPSPILGPKIHDWTVAHLVPDVATYKNKGRYEEGMIRVEIQPSLRGHPVYAYKYSVQCENIKIVLWSKPPSDTVTWVYPVGITPDWKHFDFSKERHKCEEFIITIILVRRENPDVNVWPDEFVTRAKWLTRRVPLEFPVYTNLLMIPEFGKKSDQLYHVQMRCSQKADVLFASTFQKEQWVQMLDPKCVVFSLRLWMLWPGQHQLGKPVMRWEKMNVRGPTLPIQKPEFSNRFLLDIRPRLREGRAYHVLAWCAGKRLRKSKRKMKRIKFETVIRAEWCRDEPEEESESETGSDEESGSGTETGSGEESGSGTETGSGEETESGTETGSGEETESGEETGSGTETGSGEESESGKETGSEHSRESGKKAGKERRPGNEQVARSRKKRGTGKDVDSVKELGSGSEKESGKEWRVGKEEELQSGREQGTGKDANSGKDSGSGEKGSCPVWVIIDGAYNANCTNGRSRPTRKYDISVAEIRADYWDESQDIDGLPEPVAYQNVFGVEIINGRTYKWEHNME